MLINGMSVQKRLKCFIFVLIFFKSSLYFKLLNGMHFVKHSSEGFICYTKQLNFILEVM